MDTLHRLVATFLLGTLCVGALPACDNEKEESETLVTKLRVLAVRADPAEMTTKESVTFDALVVGAQGEVSYSWSFCPLAGPSQLGFPCFSDEAGTGSTRRSAAGLLTWA